MDKIDIRIIRDNRERINWKDINLLNKNIKLVDKCKILEIE
jgi:hypothetical protein